jgi:hypothetical protein
MQLRKTILALALLAIVGGFAYYISHQPEVQKSYKLFNLAPADIAKIELRGSGRDLVVERAGPGLWRIIQPVDASADNSAVDALANAIANLEVVDTVDTNGQTNLALADFGLQNPSTTVIVTTADKRVLPGIMVGSDTPVGSNTYIKTTDKPAVLLIGAGFTAESGRTLSDLRSHVLVDLTADQMNRIAVVHADGSGFEIVRKGDNWKIVKPRAYAADNASVQQLVDMLASARVTDFIEENPTNLEKFGLAKPSIELEVNGGKNNVKRSVAIGFKQPEAGKNAVYARPGEDDRPILTIADYIVQHLDKSFDDLRDKSVLAFDTSQVARLTLFGGPVSIVLERAPGEKWNVIAQGRTAPAQPEVANSMLAQLHDLKGTSIPEDPMIDPQPFGMVHPNLTVVLYDQAGKEIGSIYVSQLEATARPDATTGKSATQTFGYATSSADKAVYAIPPSVVVDLENTATSLKSVTELKPAVPGNPLSSASPAAKPSTAAPSPAQPSRP